MMTVIVVLPDAVIPSSVLFAVGLVAVLCISLVIWSEICVALHGAATGEGAGGWS